MKKFFYNLMIMAAMIITSTTIVSCVVEEDDVPGGGSKPSKEEYLGFVYWMSNDLADIANVTTTGLPSFNCNKATTVEFGGDKINGVSTGIIEFVGDKAKKPEFAVNVKLKSNWKDLIKNKTDLWIYSSAATGNVKGNAIGLSGTCMGSKFSVADILGSAEAENIFIGKVEYNSYTHKK